MDSETQENYMDIHDTKDHYNIYIDTMEPR